MKKRINNIPPHQKEHNNRILHHKWAKGFIDRKQRVFHPYTKIGFKFDCNG